jgi:hypothetical protein
VSVLVGGAALALVVPVLLVVVAVRVVVSASDPARADDARVRRARRRAATWRGAGFVAGVALAVSTAGAGSLGRGVMLAPALFGLALVAGVLGGELAVRPPSAGPRTATLDVRRVRDYLPSGLSVAVASAAAGLLALLTATTAAGSPDDLGRAGRSLAGTCSAVLGWSTGPWPGSYYALPLAATVGFGLLAAAAVLRRVTSRPRIGGSAELWESDEALRARSAEAVTAACGVLVAAPALGVVAVTAAALQRSPCPPGWWAAATAVLLLSAVLLLGLLGWCAAVLVAPAGRRRRRDTPRGTGTGEAGEAAPVRSGSDVPQAGPFPGTGP